MLDLPRSWLVCADSFETFIRRFWIENPLWSRHAAGEPIDGEQPSPRITT